MTERIELLGGRLTIESSPGAGTVVQAYIPIGERRQPAHAGVLHGGKKAIGQNPSLTG